MADFIRFKRQGRPPRGKRGQASLYVDETGAFQTVDEAGAVGALGSGSPGGGSPPLAVVRFPFAFDTAGIIYPSAVDLGFTPAIGDFFWLASVSVTTAFDGTNPRLYVGAQGMDPNNNGDQFLGGVDLTNADGPSGSLGYNIANAFSISVFPDLASAALPLVATIDDNSGGNPGASQGEGVILCMFIVAS